MTDRQSVEVFAEVSESHPALNTARHYTDVGLQQDWQPQSQGR